MGWTSGLDWKLGARMLVKYPGLTLVGGLTLAAAIGIGAAWYEVTRQLASPRLPLPEGDRIVRIDAWDAEAVEGEARLRHFQSWREQLTTLEHVGAWRWLEQNLITPDGAAHPARVAEISPAAFPLTRVPALMGRTLVEDDARPGAPDVVVIGHDTWQTRFDADPGVLGRTIHLGRRPFTIVGVMPDGFGFPVSHELWVPLRTTSTAGDDPRLALFGRLAGGATYTSAQAEVAAITARFAALNPSVAPRERPHVAPFAAPEGVEGTLLRLSNIVAWLILLAAGANVATLMFVRTAMRESEIVVRNALGASRGRVMMQLFVEAFVLCVAAAVVGLTAASFVLEYGSSFVSQRGVPVPFWFQFGLGPKAILYAVALAMGGAAIVGLLPAIRVTGPRIQAAMKDMASGSSTIRFGPVWSVVIVLQVASAALCLPFAAFAAFFTLHDISPTFATHEYLTFRPALDPDPALRTSAESEREHLLRVHTELEQRLADEPSVAAVTYASGLPGAGFPVTPVVAQRAAETPWLVDTEVEGDRARIASVDPEFFDAMRIPLVAGRTFRGADATTHRAVIINETLARNLGGNPIGVRIRPGEPEDEPGPWLEVVGVVDDARINGNGDDFLFLPATPADVSRLFITMHVRGDPADLTTRVREIASRVEPALRLYDLMPLDDVMRRNKLPEIQAMFAVFGLTIIMLALSAAGLYSLLSVAVTRRTREIGIRLAIGANPRAVLAALFARTAAQVAIGIVLAVGLLPFTMKGVGISELRLDQVLPAMLAAAVGMLLVALIACGVPARRALRIEPTEALKYGG